MRIQTASRAREPPSKTSRATPRNRKTKLATQTGDLASNNLKDKRRTINKHTTKPETRKNEVRFCYLIFASIEDCIRPERGSLLYFLSGRHSRFDLQKRCRYASSRTYRRHPSRQGVRITPISDVLRRIMGGENPAICNGG